jgi:hypothetical protein
MWKEHGVGEPEADSGGEGVPASTGACGDGGARGGSSGDNDKGGGRCGMGGEPFSRFLP